MIKYVGSLFAMASSSYNPVSLLAGILSGFIIAKSAKGVNTEELIPAPPRIIPFTNP